MIEQERHSANGNDSATEIQKQPFSYTILKPLKRQQREEIKVGDNGNLAVITEYKTFLKLAPLYLWLACKQPQIIYYLVQSILEYFKFGQLSGQIVDISVQVFLIIVCIILEIYTLYTTYYNYTIGSQQEEGYKSYLTWNQAKSRWQMTELGNLKEGQIILVKKYLSGNTLVNPTNVLPIAYADHSRHMLIKTTRINKRQEYKKVSILPQFSELVALDQSYQRIKFHPQLFDVKIAYTFLSNLGETFEAEVIFPNSELNQPNYIITNENIVPMGIGISTQDYVIGIILKQVSGSTFKNAEKILLKGNSVSETLSKYLLVTIWINSSLMLVSYIINLIITELSTSIGRNIGSYSYQFAINFAAVFMNTVYISMHILLYIHRFYDASFNRRDLNVNCLSRIRTIDELTQVDTLIMDDFFFLERPINTDDFKCELSEQAPLTQHFDVLLKVMEQSLLLQQHMSGHIIPIIKYFRIYNNNSADRQKRCKVKIDKQQARNESLVQIKIKVSNRGIQSKFMLRFNDRSVKSSIKKLRDHDFKQKVQAIAHQHQQNISSLLLFIEIMKLDTDLTISNKYFVLYGLISFNQTFNKSTVQMLKEESFLDRFNTVIMTNKSRKYIEHFMCLSGMIRYNNKDLAKSQTGDDIIILDQMQQSQIDQTIRDYKKIFKQRRIISKKNTKQAILFLNSTMITYLSRKNIRESFVKLTPYCKYITFYNCSQFQKQICAASLFKIYPSHIFLSNYICDYSIFQWSHLSIAERGASSQMLVTFVVPKFQSLKRLILQEAMKSVQTAQIIINSHIFKNQFFLGANLVAFYLVFRGTSINLLMSYLSQIFFFFNFIFTLGPIFYLLFKRPEIFIEEDMQKCINVNRMVTYHLNSLVFGILTGFIAYCLVADQFITNVFTSILVVSVIASNFFVLLLDDSKDKTGQVVSIMIQLVLGIFMIIAIQLFQTKSFKFIESGTNFDPSNKWFYISTFAILPFVVIVTLTVFAAGKEIRLIQNQKQMGLREYQQEIGQSQQSGELLTTQSVSQMVVKIERGVGKGLRMQQQKNQVIN